MKKVPPRKPWHPADDLYLQTHWLTPLSVQAAKLKRTVEQVQQRRQRLLGRIAEQLIDKPQRRDQPACVRLGCEVSRSLRMLK